MLRQFSLGLLVLAVALAGCNGGGGIPGATSGEEGRLTGSWTGGVETIAAGLGTFTVDLSHRGDSIEGLWVTCYDNPRYNEAGTLSGEVTDKILTLTLVPFGPDGCTRELTALIDDDLLAGSFTAVACATPEHADFEIVQVDPDSINDLSGNWDGPLDVTGLGIEATAHFAFEQHGMILLGAWTVDFCCFSLSLGGELAGTIDADVLTATLRPDNPEDCKLMVNAVFTEIPAESIVGTLGSFDCDGTLVGDFSVGRVAVEP